MRLRLSADIVYWGGDISEGEEREKQKERREEKKMERGYTSPHTNVKKTARLAKN